MSTRHEPTAAGGSIDFDALLRKYDTEARYRILTGWRTRLVGILAFAMACFHFYTAGTGLLPAQTQGAVHLAFALALTFLLYPARQHSPRKNAIPWYDYILAGLSALTCLYLVYNFIELTYRAGLPTDTDLIMGILLILVLLEATRRISNPVLSCLAIAALLYCFFGRAMPDMFAHRGFSITRIVNHMYLGTEGIFGTPLEVSATFVFMFILFGAVLEKTGIGKFIIDLSLAIAGWSVGGPAKVAVVSSGLMGTVSGSSVANVCTTGMFTIPLMKSVGYPPHFAGAVEATASTGGQIMPPVMGAGAFIMAQFLGMPYTTVALAAVIPAVLYYGAVLIQVHFEAQRLGLKGLPREQLPNLWYLLKTKGFLLLPLVGIIYLLLAGFTPLKAAFYGILICIPLSWLNRETRLTPQKLFEAFESGARASLSVACACACVGMVVGTSTLTGLALRIASGIVELSSGMLLPTLVLTMCASILLGTGLPTTANFIVTSTMAAPALLQLGVPPIAAYMFVFYFGIAADLTPPVALAAYAGAGIAGSDPMKTGGTAFKLALAGLLIPYIYVFNPMLLFVDASFWPMVQAIISAFIGVFLLSMFTIGHFKAHLSWPLRCLALCGALGLLHPGTLTDVIGLGILAVIYVIQLAKTKKAAACC
ncbi:MAG TPA: TRAP transporter permease [Candidatus Avidesulfovibrio excrementigallinarum]|nr:TRAP transporter permease [Candidatus Avidesulfovibrio excrementigallinarum]